MILKQILRGKRQEIDRLRGMLSPKVLEYQLSQAMHQPTRSLIGALRKGEYPRLICEMKKASPSEGLLRKSFSPMRIAKEFEEGGASAISVLTETRFFKGSVKHLSVSRSATHLPVLRKDFLIHELQIYESRLMPADAILLIASLLNEKTLKKLYRLALRLGLEVLMEIHDSHDLKKALKLNPKLIGINNRNLKTLKINLGQAEKLIRRVPTNAIKVVESGLQSKTDLDRYRTLGVDAFLIGTSLMKAKNIKQKIRDLKETTQRSISKKAAAYETNCES